MENFRPARIFSAAKRQTAIIVYLFLGGDTMWFCSLYSGSSGNCIFVGTKRTKVLVDAGLSGKKIIKGLDEIGVSPKEIDAILVTHEHVDHTKGVGILSRMFDIPVYANNNTWRGMKNTIGNVRDDNINILDGYNPFSLGDIDIKPYSTPHDAADPVGYCFYNGGKKASIATDIGCVNRNVFENIKGSDLLLLESNHDVQMLELGPYPYELKRRILSNVGHLSNGDAGRAAASLLGSKPITVVLGHLSEQNNYPELAYKTVETILKKSGVGEGDGIRLSLADRYDVSAFFEL